MTNWKTREVWTSHEAPTVGSNQWLCPDRRPIARLAQNPKSTPAEQPFAVPEYMNEVFVALSDYWNFLKRGNATMPFEDDIRTGPVCDIINSVALVRVFEKPQRFRFDLTGHEIVRWYGEELGNRFIDELSPRPPLDLLIAQCSTTIEIGAPTFYRHAPSGGRSQYQRLLLPFWGDGRISAILAGVEFEAYME